ncbi:MAG: TIGR03750 family conjugal transfer protein [Proteobacteria bacterium]|nr:TIGR03750 family conjugal transfer protein [Pseudomonadota bacterium]
MNFNQESNELLPLRLNAEPAIFRGCSVSELMMLVMIGGAVLVPSSIIVCGLMGYLMMGVGIGLLLVIACVVIGANVMQRIKRGRPLGFYQLRLRLWFDNLHLVRSPYIRESQVWDIGRRICR